MHMVVKPGDVVVFFVRERNSQDNPWPVSAVVQQVQPGVISVPEINSKNGLGRITLIGTSERDGTYWYEYINQYGSEMSTDVMQLRDSAGNPLKCGSFIRD